MGIEQIVSKIIDEAREKAAVLRSGYEAKITKLEERWTEENKIRLTEAGEAIEAATKRERDRLITAENLDSRKRSLALKREIVDLAFDKARNAFLELPEKTYRSLLAQLIAKAAISGKEEIILDKKSHGLFGEKLVKDANELLKKRGLDTELHLGSPSAQLKAGAILRQQRMEIRRTLDELLLEVRERLEGSVAETLFEEGK